MFTLFVPYLICICIFNVIWQLNTLNGFSSVIKICYFQKNKKNKSKNETNDLFIKIIVLFYLVYVGLLFKKKK